MIRRLLAGILCLASSLVWGGVQVSPTGLYLTQEQPVGVLTLSNRGNQPTSFEVRIYRWQQEEGKDDLEATRELLVSPPVFSLEPGDQQTVRVALGRPLPESTELAYRAIFREVPSLLDTRPMIGLLLALEISIPIFVTPADAAPADIHWRATTDNRGDIVLIANNRGGRHRLFTQLTLTDAQGVPLSEPWQGISYLLPNTGRDWRFTSSTPVSHPESFIVKVKAGRQVHDVPVQLE